MVGSGQRWRAHAARAIAGASLAAAAAADARADIAPSNVRPCEGQPSGAPCTTDRCNPGACGEIRELSCRTGDPLACLACRAADAGSCDAACASERRPCFACIPIEISREVEEARRPRPTYRYDDCVGRALGDPCRTVACARGVCAGASPDALACVVEAPPRRAGALVAGALAAVAALAAGAALLRWRRRRSAPR